MAEINKAFTRNPFVEKCMSYIPDDPLTQAHYMYILTSFVFLGLLGYALSAWWQVIVAFSFKSLFSGVFMLAIAIMSLFGLKQTRNSYIMTKRIYAAPRQELKIETIDEMKKEFEGGKV